MGNFGKNFFENVAKSDAELEKEVSFLATDFVSSNLRLGLLKKFPPRPFP